MLGKTSAVVLLFCLFTFPECWVVPLSLCLSACRLFWLQLPSLPLPSLLSWDFRLSVPAYTRWVTPLSLFPSCSLSCFLLLLKHGKSANLNRVLTHRLRRHVCLTAYVWFQIVGNLLYYRYMNPAIVAPDAFDIIDMSAGGQLTTDQRRNLGSIAKMLQHAASNKMFLGDNAHLNPINEYLTNSYQKFRYRFTQCWI